MKFINIVTVNQRERERGVSQKQCGNVQWKGRGPEKGGSPGVRCKLNARQESMMCECGGLIYTIHMRSPLGLHKE